MITELAREPARAFRAEPLHGSSFSSRTNNWLELFSSWLVSHRAFLTWLGLAWLEKLELAREPARLMRSFNDNTLFDITLILY
jgi:hypothetical protein